MDLSNHTSIQKLGILDQLRVVIKNMTNDDSLELKQNDILTAEVVRLKSTLVDFIDRATDPIRRGSRTRVKLKINSKFSPVLDEVLSERKYTDYYHVDIKRPKLPFDDIQHDITVYMKVKKYA